MANFFKELDEKLIEFINAQHIFFTGSAPLSAEGRVNVSPKGMDTLRVLDKKTVAYLDLTGSGNETAAHALENGRLTIMMCSFDKNPLILRLYGVGSVIRPEDAHWADYIAKFKDLPGRRQIIKLDIHSIQTSCGYAVPFSDGMRERKALVKWAEKKGDADLKTYRREKNARSIDGLKTGITAE